MLTYLHPSSSEVDDWGEMLMCPVLKDHSVISQLVSPMCEGQNDLLG